MKPSGKENFIIAGLLLLILAISFYDVFFLNKTFKITTASAQALHNGPFGQAHNKPKFFPVIGTDTPVLEEPLLEFIKQNFRRGIIPLWNPHQACGFPIVGMLEVGMFFPLNLIMYIFPQIFAWDLLILSRFFLAGLLTYWFMRAFGFHYIPSLASAITFMLSGPMVLLQYWTANVDILVPFLLLSLDRLIRKPKLSSVTFVALMVGLTFFAGHPEHIFLVNTYGFLFFVFRILSLKKFAELKRSFLHLCCAYILGLGLSAIVLFPFLRNLFSEFWSGHPPGVGHSIEEQTQRFISLALPHFFQYEPVRLDWTFAGWWGGYLGTLPLALAVLSLFHRQRHGLNYFFFLMAFLIISKEYGLPFINWIGYLPVFNTCRYAIHTPHLAAFSVAIAAGMGVRTILFGSDVLRKSLPFTIILSLVVGFHFLPMSRTILKETLDLSMALAATFYASMILIVFHLIIWLKNRKMFNQKITGLLLISLIFVELFSYIHRERSYRFDSFGNVPYIEFLNNSPDKFRAYGIVGALYPNTASGFGVDDLGIFMSLLPKRFVDFSNALIKEDLFVNDLRPPALRAIPLSNKKYLMDLLNIKYLITPPASFMSKLIPNYNEHNPSATYADEVLIFERPSAFPRAFIVHRAFFQTDKASTFALLKKFQPQFRYVIVINALPREEIVDQFKDTPVMDNSEAQIIKYSPNEVIVEADLKHAGFLVLSDAFHPDWKVFVNGKRSEIFQTDYLIRSVFLPAGRHQVRFAFQPFSFYLGVWVTLFSFAIILIFSNIDRLKIFNKNF